MDSKPRSKARRSNLLHGAPTGFDIVERRIIGRVELGRDGTKSPVAAAFEVIAPRIEESTEPATYEFPGPYGTVVVSTELDFGS